MAEYELQFRNINATPDDPVETWGPEGYLTAIERGDLKHWTRMRRYARAHPWSDAAEDMLQAARLADDFGTGSAALIRLAIERAREANPRN